MVHDKVVVIALHQSLAVIFTGVVVLGDGFGIDDTTIAVKQKLGGEAVIFHAVKGTFVYTIVHRVKKIHTGVRNGIKHVVAEGIIPVRII